MKITPITSYNQKPSFKKINQKYLHWAIEDIKLCKNVSCDWLQMMHYEVYLFKNISIRDALDTVLAVKEIMCGKKDDAIEDLIRIFKSSND